VIYDINNYPEILYFLEKSSIIGLKTHSSNKFQYSRPCIYCDDATRKSSIDHGHLYIAKTIPFFKCFRCDAAGHIKKLLLDLDFDNYDIIKLISSNQKYNLISKKTEVYTNYQDIYQTHKTFKNKYQNEYLLFIDYIYKRIGSINYLYFKLSPSKLPSNYLLLNFNNYDNILCNSRIISSKKTKYRYIKPESKSTDNYYYFQDINNIYKYKNIVICEGEIDLINLYLYGGFTKNDSFFITSGGKSGYYGLLDYLITNYIIIGYFTIHIILDKDCNNKYINNLKFKLNSLKKRLNISYYKSIEKDVSVDMLYYKLI